MNQHKNGQNIFRPCFRQGINIWTISRTLKRKISLKINNNKKSTWFDLELVSKTKQTPPSKEDIEITKITKYIKNYYLLEMKIKTTVWDHLSQWA